MAERPAGSAGPLSWPRLLDEPRLRVNAYIAVEVVDGHPMMVCRCGEVLGPAGGDYKQFSLEARYPVQRAGPLVNPYDLGSGRFELREFYCPNCLVLYETDVADRDDPNIHDVELAESSYSAHRSEVNG